MRLSGLLICGVFLSLVGASCAQKQSEPAGYAEPSPGRQSLGYPSSTSAAPGQQPGYAQQPGYPRLDTLEDAERAYADAERELVALYAPSSISTEQSAEAGGEGKPKDPAPPRATAGGASGGVPSNRCERVCQALGSLERARDAICRLTSETDERCNRANISVEKNRERASQCACPKPAEPATEPDGDAPDP